MKNFKYKRLNHSETCITVKVSSWETHKFEIHPANERYALAIFSTGLKTILEVLLKAILKWCWRQTELTNQKLLKTLSEYTFSWYKQTWLRTERLATRRHFSCIAFLSFHSSKLATFKLLDSFWTAKPQVTYNSNPCSKHFFFEFKLTWETGDVKNYTLSLSVSIILFWCLETPPATFLNSKTLQDGFSRQVESPSYRGIGGERWCGFSAIAHNLGEPLFHFGVLLSY